MASSVEFLVAATSTITRLSAFTFLRWIPGHHFPPVILLSTALYLTLVYAYSSSFGTGRPSLREAFPKLFKEKSNQVQQNADTASELPHDEPALYHDEKSLVKTLFLGIPNWEEWEFSYITIVLNVLAALLSLDLVLRGPLLYDGKDLRFSRLGYIDDSNAKILVREPDLNRLPLYSYLRQSSDSGWSTVDTRYHLSEEEDYTYPLILSGLKPDTAYTYILSNELAGTFRTAPAPNTEAAKSLTFLTSSCIKANFPYNPFAHSLSISGFKHVSKVLRSLPSPASFMLFLGDFIYVDVPFRLSSTQKHYRSEYRRVYQSPSWNLPGLKLPWLHTLDDHEIANDWAGGNETEPFPSASDPFMHYHVSVNPPLPPGVPTGSESNNTFFQFKQGPASFFMLDTRRYRTRPEPNTTNGTNKAKPLYVSSATSSQDTEYAPSMLGSIQLRALLSFLTKPEPANVQWKFVASSVPFTKNWRFGTADTWGGFLTERKKILDAMHFAEQNLGVRVIILSGDRHEFAAIRFPPPSVIGPEPHSTAVDTVPTGGPHEFSVGPLSMFYLPFRTFKQIDDQDIALAYFPDGNSKLGSISIGPASRTSGKEAQARSRLTYTLWIDGQTVWKYDLISPSAQRSKSNWQTWSKVWI